MNEVSIDLFDPSNNEVPRYTIHILDQKASRENGRYAAFIVPQGRLVYINLNIFSQFAVETNLLNLNLLI